MHIVYQRVAHRLALDYTDDVYRLITLNIAPTVDFYETTGPVFASLLAVNVWSLSVGCRRGPKSDLHHRPGISWFFLIQLYPFPEEMIEHFR